MRVKVVYNAYPLRQITRCANEEIEVGEPADLRCLLRLLGERHGVHFAGSQFERMGERLQTALLCDGTGVKSLDQDLHEGSTVNFIMHAAGG